MFFGSLVHATHEADHQVMAKVDSRSRLSRWVEHVLQVGAPTSPTRPGAEIQKRRDDGRNSGIRLDA